MAKKRKQRPPQPPLRPAQPQGLRLGPDDIVRAMVFGNMLQRPTPRRLGNQRSLPDQAPPPPREARQTAPPREARQTAPPREARQNAPPQPKPAAPPQPKPAAPPQPKPAAPPQPKPAAPHREAQPDARTETMPAARPAEKTCPSCQRRLPVTASFCPYCSNKLDG